MSGSQLQRLLSTHGPSIDREIRRCLAHGQVTPEFSGMMAYQLGYVDASLRPIDESGGKRLRPLLCLLACESVGGTPQQALTVAASIEILHNFSLVHDDIEDRDATRRHRPTVWKLWGEAHGINVGDGMFAVATRAILDAPSDPATVLDIARRFGDTARALTEGQYLDMSFEFQSDVRADEYADMAGRKTGSLIEFSLWAGARIGGADAGTLAAVGEFGREVGKAFQIHDDVSGIWSSQDRTGKEPGKDLWNRKKTLPLLLAAKHAREPFRSVLAAYMKGDLVDVSTVIEALDAAGARAYAEERVVNHLSRARQALSNARISTVHASTFLGLADEVTGQPAARS